jgi:putative transposase
MYYVRYPLSLRQVEDILHERGIDVSHESVRSWWNRFGIELAKKINSRLGRFHSNWRWHIDEVFVEINGQQHYLGEQLIMKGTCSNATYQSDVTSVKH